MKKTISTHFTFLSLLLWVSNSFAQSITTVSSTPSNACAGSTISVAFTKTGTITGTYKVQLSSAAGTFTVATDLVTTGAVSPLTATIPTGTAAGAGYKIRVVNSAPATLGTEIALTIGATPAPPVLTSAQSAINYCLDATALPLTATASPGNTLKWYNPANVGSATAYTPDTDQSGTFQYEVSQVSATGCESTKVPISVVIAAPLPPTLTSAQSTVNYCRDATATALTATASPGNTLKWYNPANVGSTTAYIPPTNVATTLTYHVSQVSATGCESAKVPISVIITAPAVAVILTPSQSDLTYCENTPASPLTATALANHTLKWYNPASASSATPYTPLTNAVGAFVYKVSQLNAAGCEGPTSDITVTIKANPVAPTATSPVDYCFGSTAVPLATTSGTNLKWYTLPTGGSGVTTPPTPNTNTAGSITHYVSQTVNGCESPRKAIVVNVYKTAPPVTETTVEYCKGAVATPLQVTGSGLLWYTTATGGTGDTQAPTIVTTTVQNKIYFVSQTLNNCESERIRIDVSIKNVPNAPTVTDLAAVCLNQSVTATQVLNAVTAATGTLKWYATATSVPALSGAPTPVTTTAGIKNYYVTQSVNGCESVRETIALDVKALPLAPTVSTPVDLCQLSTGTPLTATAAGTNTLSWYTVATNGTALTTAPTPVTTTVGNTVYYVSQSQRFSPTLACEGPRAPLTVTINALPAAPAVTQYIACQTRQDELVTLSATPTSPNTVKWYSVATNGTALSAAPVVNLKNSGETTYYASQVTAKSCESTSRAVLKARVKRLPALPAVTPNIEYCQFAAASPLNATLETSASPNWYTVGSGGNGSGAAPTPSTQDGGTTSFFVSQTLEGCEGDRSEIKVLIKTTPKPTTVSPLSFCQNAEAGPVSAQGRDLKWYFTPTATEFRTQAFIPVTTNVTDYSFYVTQTGTNGCESPKEEIKIHIKPFPSATISGDQSISLGSSAEIKIQFTGEGPWNYSIAPTTITGSTSQNPLVVRVSPERTTTYLVTEVSNECGKGTPIGRAMVTVRIPTISTGNPNLANQCAGKTFTVPYQASGDFVTGNQFNVQISKVNDDKLFFTIPTVRNATDATGTLPDTLSAGTYFVRVVAESTNLIIPGSVSASTILVDPLPQATILTTNTTILAGASAQISIRLTGKPSWTFNLTDGISNTPVTTSVNPYIATVTPAATTIYKITRIENACGIGKVIGEARVQVDPILGVEPANNQWVSVLPTLVSTECVVTLKDPVQGRSRIQLYDIQGRTVIQHGIHQTSSGVNMSKVPAGIYFLRVENGGKTAVFRILKAE